MSRNKEKAQSLLNRYHAQKSKEAGVLESNPNLRPKYVQSVQSLPQSEKWRQSILTEISVKLTKINDPTIPEYEIRQLNDSLNKLHREKRAWEYHIRELGGNDYISYSQSAQGINVKGTRYYGRARELLEVQQMTKSSEKKTEISKKSLPLSYYGVYDRDDWVKPIVADRVLVMEEINGALGERVLPAEIGETKEELPTNEDVERWMVERRKKELLAKLRLA